MKMKKSRIVALILALMMCFALASCGKKAPVEEPKAEGTNAAALKMGFIGPLTGGAALYGQAAERGAKIAVEEINAAGGNLAIDFKSMDDEHDAEKAIYAYQQLQDWGAQVVVGTVTTTPCNAVAAEAFTDRMFMLTPSASSPAVVKDRDNVYQLCFSDPNQGTASAQYIAEKKLATKVAVIYNNADAYSTGIYQTFVESAKTNNLNVVSVTTFTDDTANDFTVQLKDAQQKGADLVFLPIYYTPASLILKQAADMNYNVKFFGCDGLDGLLGIEGFDAKLAEGVMLLTPFAADATDDKTKAFVEKYEAAYNEKPSQFAADGYDCVYALYEASKKSGQDVTKLSAKEMCELMIKTFSSPDFSVNGLTGAGMTWKATGEVSKAPKAVVIQNGAYVGM
ncbi:MAG: amino acid/amide transporter substrate-binding protein family [Evtepia sp.]|nr:amino acid/amide transporter substrate-binding protein family [Evtepia sp.]